MKLDKPLMVAGRSRLLPRILRALLLVLVVVTALGLLGASKALESRGADAGMEPQRMHPRFALVAGTARAARARYSRADHAILDSTAAGGPAVGLKSRMPRLFWPIVAVVTILYTTTAAPRLRQSLWDDEIYAVRKIVLGTDRIQSDGSVKIKQLPWWRTLWHCEGARNHGLQSVLSRVSLAAYQTVVQPDGLQFSETAIRLPSFIAGALSIPALALLVARLGFPWAGIIAAALLALHPWHLKLATEARGYPFVFLFIPLMALCIVHAAPNANWRWLAGFAALELALLYAWPGTLLTVAGCERSAAGADSALYAEP